MYKILFIDNTQFIGGEPQNSKWLEIPDKPIHSLGYKVGNILIIMRGYESYNHVVKYGISVNKKSKNNPMIQIILMGKNKEKVQRIIIDFIKQDINQDIVNFGEEYNNKPHPGWTSFHKSSVIPFYKIKKSY